MGKDEWTFAHAYDHVCACACAYACACACAHTPRPCRSGYTWRFTPAPSPPPGSAWWVGLRLRLRPHQMEQCACACAHQRRGKGAHHCSVLLGQMLSAKSWLSSIQRWVRAHCRPALTDATRCRVRVRIPNPRTVCRPKALGGRGRPRSTRRDEARALETSKHQQAVRQWSPPARAPARSSLAMTMW